MALSIQGTPGAAAATTITLPTHAAGDLIIVAAYRDGNTTPPTVPSAGGTVPTWNTIDGPTGANTNSLVVCWAKATANNHTSGTWTNATGLAVIVYRGQNPGGPIGGHAQAGGSGANTNTAPAVTLSKTDGTSAIVHVGGNRNVTAWGALAAGYTNRANVATEIRLVTKDTTTSDGTVSLVPTNVSSGSGYRTESLEVLVAVDITKTVGVVAEAGSAQALSRTQAAQSKSLNPAAGAGAAVALQKTQQAQTKMLGVAAGTGAAVALSRSQAAQSKTVGAVTGTGAAQPLSFQMVSNDQHVDVSPAVGTGAAQALTRTQQPNSRTVGQAAETGSAQPLTHSQTPQTTAVGPAAETGEAMSLSPSQTPQTTSVSAASDTGSALPLTVTQTPVAKTLGAAVETGEPVALTFTSQPITVTVGAATETGFAVALSPAGQNRVSVVPVAESGAAPPLSYTQTPLSRTLAVVSETGAAVRLVIAGHPPAFDDPTTGTVDPDGGGYGHLVGPFTGRLVR